MSLGEEKKIEITEETVFFPEGGINLAESKFLKEFDEKYAGKILFEIVDGKAFYLEKAISLIKEDLKDKYFSTLEDLAKKHNKKINFEEPLFQKKFDPYDENFKTLSNCMNHANLSIVTVAEIKIDGEEPSKSFNCEVLSSLEYDLAVVVKIAEEDFELYKKNLKYNKKEVKITPWKRIVAGIVVGTALLTTAVSGFVFSYIFDKKVDGLEKNFDDKIKVFDENLESLEEKFDFKIKGAAGVIITEFENKYENFWKRYDSDQEFREKINQKVWYRLNNLAGSYEKKTK